MGDHKRKILDRINTPADLKRLNLGQLHELAEEIREEILGAIAESGGHLASSLGVIELTIALHYVFDAPNDKFIFDVGHQAYAHKILTGRRRQFATIRRFGGLSGFPRREESEYDAFGTGHASTSVSAALGMAEAMRLEGRKGKAVAVIGDGGLSGGQALEALNQTPSGYGKSLENLVVILNDNEMSIGPSVGAISRILSRAAAGRKAFRLIKWARRVTEPLPLRVKMVLSEFNRRWRRAVFGLFTPGMLIESFGYRYLGPIYGHSIEQLIYYMERAKDIDEPILLHVLTKKGKGYDPAEENPEDFHGIGPFDLKTGNGRTISRAPTYTEIFSKTMLRLFEAHPKLIAITAAMSQGTGLDHVKEKFPGRVFDLGITEPHCVTFAAGAACEGLRPVVAIYSTFLQRSYDQILHDVCIQRLPVIFCLDRAGIVGEDGPTHQGLFDLTYLRTLPNMVVMAPKDENEFQHMLAAALTINQPVAIRYPRGRAEGVALDEELHPVPFGKAELLRGGKDLALVAIGNMVGPSLKASEMLAERGIQASVVNARFAKPLDEELLLKLMDECKVMVTVEENVLAGGFGSSVMELMESRGVDWVKFCRVGIPDRFVEQGPPQKLREIYGLDAKGIFRRVLDFLATEEITAAKI